MGCARTTGGMADGAVSGSSAGGCTSCKTLAVVGDIGWGIWKAGGSGRAVPCTGSRRLSVGDGGGEAAAVRVDSADSVDTAGDETVVAGDWPVSTPDSSRRLCVNGTRSRGPRVVTIREVDETRPPSIPATARILAAAVTPYHQR